jgi:pyruvate decarboxylase
MDIARKEVDGEKGRTVLVTGDGSMALTIQEIGTMIKQKLKVVIFVINNAGYTIERVIWGAQQRTHTPFGPSLRYSPKLKFNMY